MECSALHLFPFYFAISCRWLNSWHMLDQLSATGEMPVPIFRDKCKINPLYLRSWKTPSGVTAYTTELSLGSIATE